MKICIIGLGYIGLPTATMFATHGVDVVGVDVNENVLNKLQNGSIHIEEPGLQEIFQEAIHNKKLTIKNTPETADAFIIAVPTPFLHDDFGEYQGKKYKKADMSYVISATESILPFLEPGNLVILESTSPPRTTVDLIKPTLERSGLLVGTDLYLAYSPERVLPGKILIELKENARVIGGITQESAEKGRDLYARFVQGEIVLTDATTAEMVKLMENTYRDINIAIANEFSRLAERFGIDVWEAIKIANLHPRVNILNPGPGVGGHCISVDPWFLVEAAPDIAPLIHTARDVNDSQPVFIVKRIKEKFYDLKGKKITLLGLSYKPDVDDLRESPSLAIAKLLIDEGAIVMAYEPNIIGFDFRNIVNKTSLLEAIINVDIIIICVAHQEFKENLSSILQYSNVKFILDAVNILGDEKKQFNNITNGNQIRLEKYYGL